MVLLARELTQGGASGLLGVPFSGALFRTRLGSLPSLEDLGPQENRVIYRSQTSGVPNEYCLCERVEG